MAFGEKEMKMSRRSSLFVAIGSLLTIVFLSVLLPDVDAQKGAKRLKTADLTAAADNVGLATVVINELDADQVGADAGEFVELKTSPGANLNGLVLVFYNGSNDLSYAAYDLDGLTADSNGFVVLGNAAVPGVDVIFAGDGLQNGQDAVALYAADATSFPTNTPVTTTNLIDAVVYDTADPDDPGLLVLLNPGAAQVQVDENGSASGTTVSIQRCGSALRDGRSFILGIPSPSGTNSVCPVPQSPNVDMNGDGRTDFVITRQSAPGANMTSKFADGLSRGERRRERLMRPIGAESLAGGGSQFEWWIDYNNAPGGTAGVWGLAQVDFSVSADFDGDNTDDVAIWRPGVPGEAGFYSINSSDGTFRYSDFGLTGDDSTVVGDYDGDGFDDPATFRCPDSAPGQCYFFFRGSLNNPTNGITYIPWGFGTLADYYPYSGDFNGDGKYDFCVQDIKPDTEQATFWLWLNGTETREAIQWGLDSDFLYPGDLDGDGKSDLTVSRFESGKIVFYILERDGGMRAVQWGIDSDIPVPGDYDGDGKQDIAVYRWNTTDATFWILPSNGDPYWTADWGVPFDEPLAAWYAQ